MAPDTQAPVAMDDYAMIVQAEVAMELLNRAQALIQARIYEIENTSLGNAGEAAHLLARGEQLYRLLRTIHYREPENTQAVIDHWSVLLRDEHRFWQSMRDDQPILAA